MTATATETAADPITDAQQVYRRSQQIPFPAEGAGDLMKAQSQLWHRIEPFTRTYGPAPEGEPDLDAIEDAIDWLCAAVEWRCGTKAAGFVAGDESSDEEGDEAA